MAERQDPAPANRPITCRPRTRAGLRVLAGLALLYLATVPAPVCAGDTGRIAGEEAKLQQLRERISGLKSELESVRGEHDARQAALRETDTAIGQIMGELRALDGREAEARQELARLEGERDAVRQQLGRMRSVLERELRTAYRNGRQERIKLLLNQDDPARVGRLLTYQGYFTRARGQRMDAFRASLAQLQAAEQVVLEQQETLAGLRAEQEQQASRLGAEKQHQAGILRELEQRLTRGRTELDALQADEVRVNKLVDSLRQALRDIPADTGRQPLAKLKGKLEWPVAGRIGMRFGARQATGKMRARGVHIVARDGADVHAIARGRVVFADWLRGFGLLMILDHGDGYMSLYGENSSLYKGVGEWVGRGEVIAAAGNSGGQLRTGLYLELRKDGQPVDPGDWFKGQPVAQRAVRDGPDDS